MTYFENHTFPPLHLINEPVDGKGNTLLHQMCQNSATTADDIQRMVLAGADVNALNHQSQPPLSTAITQDRADLVTGFLNAGASSFFPTKDKKKFFNAVFLCVDHQRFDILKQILNTHTVLKGINQPGMDCNGNQTGLRPLHTATQHNQPIVIRDLLRAGALVDLPCASAEPSLALHMAIKGKLYAAAQVLLKNGADIEKPCPQTGQRALHIAARFGNTTTADLLIRYGANIHATCKNGKTALHYASNEDNISKTRVAEKLLKVGAKINVTDHDKKTPLMYAAYASNATLVEMFLSHKADVLLSDTFNKTALNFARESYAHYSARNVVEGLLKKAEEKAHLDKFKSGYDKHKNKDKGFGGPK